METVLIQTKQKEKPKVQKYEFREKIKLVSACESEFVYSVLAVLKDDAYVIHGNGEIVNIGQLNVSYALIANESNKLVIFGGTQDGVIAKTSLDSKDPLLIANACASGVSHMKLTNCGKMLACGFQNGTVSVFSTSDFTLTWTNSYDIGAIRAIAWSSDNRYMAFGGQNDICYVIDAASDYEMLSFESHQSFVNALSFDKAFETVRIFSCAEDATVAVSELSGASVTTMGPFAKPLREISCFSKLMVGIDADGTIMCWRRAPNQ